MSEVKRKSLFITQDYSVIAGRNRAGGCKAAVRVFPAAERVATSIGWIAQADWVRLARCESLAPEQTVRVDFVLVVSETREAAMALVEKYQDPLVSERCFDLARTDVALGELGATDAEAQTYARLAAALIYADPAKRAAPGVLLANRCGQSGLWKYGVSGDIPIAVLRIRDPAKIQLAKQLIQAHSYWRVKALLVDLVILIDNSSDSSRPLHDQKVAAATPGRKIRTSFG